MFHLELDSDDEQETNQQKRDYWRNQLALLNIVKLPDQSLPDQTTTKAQHREKLHFNLQSVHINELQSKIPNTSLDLILTAVFLTLLNRYNCNASYSGENDGITDITLHVKANDHLPLPLRVKFNHDARYIDVLTLLAQAKKEAIDHALPLHEIHEAMPNESFQGLQSTIASHLLLNFDYQKRLQQTESNEWLSKMFKISLSPLKNGDYQITFNRDASILSQPQINRLFGHLNKIVLAAADNPSIKISMIPLLLEAEISDITQYNATQHAPHFGEMMVPDVIHAISHRIPERKFLVFHHQHSQIETLSYRQFDIFTNQIANYLLTTCGLNPGDRVAVSLTRSLKLPAFCFGVMKAGLILVPLETQQSTLLQHKIQHSGAKLFIADHATERLIRQADLTSRILNIETNIISNAILASSLDYPSPKLEKQSPAYIEYSSGTTSGIPKASLLSHGGFVNLLNGLTHLNYPHDKGVMCTALPTFDAFLFDFLAALATDGTVHMTSDAERLSPEAVERIIRANDIFLGVFLPDFMSKLPTDLPLTNVISMGAASYAELLEQLKKSNPNMHIQNGWGPTEGGICVSLQTYAPGSDSNLIGTPINNMHLYILDPRTLSICPPGVSGEIFVEGPGLALEYIDNPRLTREKFISAKYDARTQKFTPCAPNNPKATILYKCGDNGRYQTCANGTLSLRFEGRSDRQIKLCGVSIDLDSIEDFIREINNEVTAVSVIANSDVTALFAYVVLKRPMAEREAQSLIWAHLKKTPTPAVAYPLCLLMRQLPTTANGKIDTKELIRLREPKPHAPKQGQSLTTILSNMWKDVLRHHDSADLDLHTSFQEFGGNSMSLAGLQNVINQVLALTRRIGVDEKFNTFMTITSLADALTPLLKKNSALQHQRGTWISSPPSLFQLTSRNNLISASASPPASHLSSVVDAASGKIYFAPK